MLTKRLFALLLLWLQLLLQVWAGGQAGGLEKIYLWGCYNIAWAQFGPTQGEILKRTGKKYTGSVNSNWGKYDPDGKLSFGEFMDALTGREYGTCTVPEPGPGDNLLDVAQKLADQGYGSKTLPQKANARLGGGKGKYTRLIKGLYAMVTQARGAAEGGKLGPKGDLKDVLNKHVPMMEDASDSITRIRAGEFVDPWAIRDFATAFNIPEDMVRTFDYEDYKLGTTYKRIDPDLTIQDNQLHGKNVYQWIINYGSKAWAEANTPGYTPASNSHYDVLDTWKGANKEIQKTGDECV